VVRQPLEIEEVKGGGGTTGDGAVRQRVASRRGERRREQRQRWKQRYRHKEEAKVRAAGRNLSCNSLFVRPVVG
jgi:hypothetical protein